LKHSYSPRATGDDNPKVRGTPDSSLLNRSESYEMLYFVNKFANDYGSGKSGVALKAERLIKLHLPSDKRSHANVTDWLRENWKKFE